MSLQEMLAAVAPSAVDLGGSRSDIADTIDPEDDATQHQAYLKSLPYPCETDEQMLAEIQPRYIIMFEPNLDFVRRIEVRDLFRHLCHITPLTSYCRRCIGTLTQALGSGCTCWYTAIVVKR